MKMVKLYMPLLLIISSFVFFTLGAKASNNQTTHMTPPVVTPNINSNKPLTDNEMMTAKFIVEALAERYSLPVIVNIEKEVLKITSQNNTAIEQYDSIGGFISAVRGLPYSMKYKELCIGKGCGNVLTMVIEVQK